MINTVLFLNTAFSVIDKMFIQEIANAEIKKVYWFRFFLNNLCVCFFRHKYSKIFLPRNYIAVEDIGGDLLRKIMGFSEKKSPRK
jgi:hypothetical protein